MRSLQLISCLMVAVLGTYAVAADYVEESALCHFSATQEDINKPSEQALPYLLTANFKMVYIQGTEQTVKSSWSFWKQDTRSSEPLPKSTLEKLDAAVIRYVAAKHVGYFDININELSLEDIVAILRHLGATNLVNTDPIQYSTYQYWNAIKEDGWIKNLNFPLSFQFLTYYVSGYRMQFHLPPLVKDGLSLHLTVACKRL